MSLRARNDPLFPRVGGIFHAPPLEGRWGNQRPSTWKPQAAVTRRGNLVRPDECHSGVFLLHSSLPGFVSAAHTSDGASRFTSLPLPPCQATTIRRRESCIGDGEGPVTGA